MPVDTRKAPRRDLSLASLRDLEAELARLEAAAEAGRLGHTGNWTPGMIAEHCAAFMRGSLDGFPVKPAPWIVRVLARSLFIKQLTGPEPMAAGVKPPGNLDPLMPSPSVSDRVGLAELRRQVERLKAGAKMMHPSPIFGKLTHEQWMVVHLKHCAMHMSFIALR